ncbi:MAG TPA: recombination mediator RecR [Terriglobales bacterium]|nr:recombination mediator RecR [Terriglobales bacterium]
MSAFPAPLQRLVQELTKLPSIGEKTATRLALHLLRSDRRDVDLLADALVQLREQIKLCSTCLALTDSDPCPLCSDPQRDPHSLCVIEQPADVMAIERSGQFRGRYHVLHGRLAPLDGIGPEQLRLTELLHRLEGGVITEVVIATNPTVEGEATALYLARLIKPLGVRVTRIAHGLPVGSDVEYADSMTIGHALDGRREM